jgi:hypothetical protein
MDILGSPRIVNLELLDANGVHPIDDIRDMELLMKLVKSQKKTLLESIKKAVQILDEDIKLLKQIDLKNQKDEHMIYSHTEVVQESSKHVEALVEFASYCVKNDEFKKDENLEFFREAFLDMKNKVVIVTDMAAAIIGDKIYVKNMVEATSKTSDRLNSLIEPLQSESKSAAMILSYYLAFMMTEVKESKNMMTACATHLFSISTWMEREKKTFTDFLLARNSIPRSLGNPLKKRIGLTQDLEKKIPTFLPALIKEIEIFSNKFIKDNECKICCDELMKLTGVFKVFDKDANDAKLSPETKIQKLTELLVLVMKIIMMNGDLTFKQEHKLVEKMASLIVGTFLRDRKLASAIAKVKPGGGADHNLTKNTPSDVRQVILDILHFDELDIAKILNERDSK